MLKTVLENYLNSDIGVNVEKPLTIKRCLLQSVNQDHFCVLDHEHGYRHYFFYHAIIQVIEHPEGVEVGGFFEHHEHFPLVIKVNHSSAFTPV